jgi:condensin complex subunit 1
LTYYEHLSEPMAELVTLLAKEFEKPTIGEELLRELGSRDVSDLKGPKTVVRFLVKLAELNPRMVLKMIVVLQRQLDSEVSLFLDGRKRDLI